MRHIVKILFFVFVTVFAFSAKATNKRVDEASGGPKGGMNSQAAQTSAANGQAANTKEAKSLIRNETKKDDQKTMNHNGKKNK